MDLSIAEHLFWQKLEQGAHSRHSDYHSMCICYPQPGQAPGSATVILRDIDHDKRSLYFHTDYRSNKIQHMQDEPVSGVFYSKQDKLQLRFIGRSRIHHANELTQQRWDQMQPISYECYRQTGTPGTTIADEDHAPVSLERAYHNFCVAEIALESIDILNLTAAGHQRVRIDYRHRYQIQRINP